MGPEKLTDPQGRVWVCKVGNLVTTYHPTGTIHVAVGVIHPLILDDDYPEALPGQWVVGARTFKAEERDICDIGLGNYYIYLTAVEKL